MNKYTLLITCVILTWSFPTFIKSEDVVDKTENRTQDKAETSTDTDNKNTEEAEYNLHLRAAAGEVLNYKTNLVQNIGDTKISFVIKQAMKIIKSGVWENEIEIKHQNESIKVNDSDTNYASDFKLERICNLTLKKSGEIINIKTSDKNENVSQLYRMSRITQVILPSDIQNVKKGSRWNIKLEAKSAISLPAASMEVFFTEVNKENEAILQWTYKELDTQDPIDANGKCFINIENGIINKYEANINNIKFPGYPIASNSTINQVLVKEEKKTDSGKKAL